MNAIGMKFVGAVTDIRILLIWRFCKFLTFVSWPLVVGLNFYGLYTHKFYWLKPDNFILPLVSLIHLLYLREVQKRINQNRVADFPLQKLEFAMYGVSLIYAFELLETTYELLNVQTFNKTIIPETFWSEGLGILFVRFTYLVLTAFSFYIRKRILGTFNFDQINPSNKLVPEQR